MPAGTFVVWGYLTGPLVTPFWCVFGVFGGGPLVTPYKLRGHVPAGAFLLWGI
jgi:hypothetical protein